MDTKTGRIMPEDQLRSIMGEDDFSRFAVPIDAKNLTKKQRVELVEVGSIQIKPRTRCPCGSGKRFKSCCMWKSES